MVIGGLNLCYSWYYQVRETQTEKIGGETMDITRIDSDTLAIAKLVSAAEGITLEQAIRDQVELFS